MGYMEVDELHEFRVQHNGGGNGLPVDQEKYPREVQEALNSFPSKTQTGILPSTFLEMIDHPLTNSLQISLCDTPSRWLIMFA